MQRLQNQRCWSLPWKLTTACCSVINCTNILTLQQKRYSTYNHTLNFYHILGLENGATHAQIKSAYYKLSKRYHPDRNEGSKSSQDMFSKINEAYSVLGNRKLRRRYDQGILTHRDRMGQQPHHSQTTAQAGPTARDMRDQFTDAFRSARTERVIDEFLRKRYRANFGKHQEEIKNKQMRTDEYRQLQERAQRTPFIFVILILIGFAYVTINMQQMGLSNNRKVQTSTTKK